MADGSDLELQEAIDIALSSDMAVTALLGSPLRLYQDTPTPVMAPYATFGTVTVTDDSNECQAATDVHLDIEIWSRATGFEEIKRIASAVRTSLNRADLSLDTQRCVLLEHVTTRHSRGNELPMKQAILTFHAILEERPSASNITWDNGDNILWDDGSKIQWDA